MALFAITQPIYGRSPPFQVPHTSKHIMGEVCTNFRDRIPSGGDVVEGIVSSDMKNRDICLYTYLILGSREYNAIVGRIQTTIAVILSLDMLCTIL